jgi:hypothetical protein
LKSRLKTVNDSLHAMAIQGTQGGSAIFYCLLFADGAGWWKNWESVKGTMLWFNELEMSYPRYSLFILD